MHWIENDKYNHRNTTTIEYRHNNMELPWTRPLQVVNNHSRLSESWLIDTTLQSYNYKHSYFIVYTCHITKYKQSNSRTTCLHQFHKQSNITSTTVVYTLQQPSTDSTITQPVSHELTTSSEHSPFSKSLCPKVNKWKLADLKCVTYIHFCVTFWHSV